MRIRIEVILTPSRYTREYGRFAENVLRRASSFFRKNARWSVSVSFVGDAKMRSLNRRYRGKDKTTNVLAFPLPSFAPKWRGEGEGGKDIGDIFISIPEMKREARLYGWRRGYALARLLTHAFLHLLGYDHERQQDAKRMEALERRILKSLSI